MEARVDWHDARPRRVRSTDLARAYANQFVVNWFFVCCDFWFGIDSGNAFDVGIDWFAVRVDLTKTHSPPSGNTDSRRRAQHLLWNLVRVRGEFKRRFVLIHKKAQEHGLSGKVSRHETR